MTVQCHCQQHYKAEVSCIGGDKKPEYSPPGSKPLNYSKISKRFVSSAPHHPKRVVIYCFSFVINLFL